jgi:hypothetical protein
VTNPEVKAQFEGARDKFKMPPEEQPADIDVGEIIVRSTAQS